MNDTVKKIKSMKKYYLYVFVCLFGLMSCISNSNKHHTPDKIEEINIPALEQQGFKLFQENPQKAIPIFQEVAIAYQDVGNYKKAGITNLNIANIYDEHSNRIDSALIYAEKSLRIWTEHNDSLQIANLYKYIGLLKGKIGKFDEATTAIQEAIKIYQAKAFEQGIAVSEFDLADVYFRAKKYEESERLFAKSKAFWVTQNNQDRVYTNNILGIRLFEQTAKPTAVKQLIEENIAIEKRIALNDFIKNKFEAVKKEVGYQN